MLTILGTFDVVFDLVLDRLHFVEDDQIAGVDGLRRQLGLLFPDSSLRSRFGPLLLLHTPLRKPVLSYPFFLTELRDPLVFLLPQFFDGLVNVHVGRSNMLKLGGQVVFGTSGGRVERLVELQVSAPTSRPFRVFPESVAA